LDHYSKLPDAQAVFIKKGISGIVRHLEEKRGEGGQQLVIITKEKARLLISADDKPRCLTPALYSLSLHNQCNPVDCPGLVIREVQIPVRIDKRISGLPQGFLSSSQPAVKSTGPPEGRPLAGYNKNCGISL
jgi:hypothetical protein